MVGADFYNYFLNVRFINSPDSGCKFTSGGIALQVSIQGAGTADAVDPGEASIVGAVNLIAFGVTILGSVVAHGAGRDVGLVPGRHHGGARAVLLDESDVLGGVEALVHPGMTGVKGLVLGRLEPRRRAVVARAHKIRVVHWRRQWHHSSGVVATRGALHQLRGRRTRELAPGLGYNSLVAGRWPV